jgi:hypothetical protein
VVLNAFFWLLDLMIGTLGLQWAYWITLLWGLALVSHIVAYLIDSRGVREHKAQQYLDQERRGSAR